MNQEYMLGCVFEFMCTVYVEKLLAIDHFTVSVAVLDVGQSRQNYSKCRGYSSTFNADNSAIIHRISTKKTSFKRY